MNETAQEGGCGCGAVRFRVSGPPISVNNCHCRQCQQQTGSTSVVNAFFEMDRIAVLRGLLNENELVGGSGSPHFIVRCAACGVALWSHYARFGRLGAGVRVGAFDEPKAFTPDAVIFVGEKMPWVSLPEGIPAFEAGYDPRDVLPPGRFERLSALALRARA